MAGSPADFFAHQEAARRRTGILVVYYVLAVILIMFAVYMAFAVVLFARSGGDGSEGVAGRSLWNPDLFLWVMIGTGMVVLTGTLYKISSLSHGGESVACMLGGRPINRNTRDPDERKVLNVVDEMAIASGLAAPPVFVLDNEDGINAFAAGFSPRDAVVGVTRGCIRLLSRDELQGVIAHEFSHVLNGDMRLNIQLMGVLHGILVIALLGYWTFRVTASSPSGRRRSRDKGGGSAIMLLGLLIMAVGYIGVLFANLIKSAVSRQREHLADASAVQFTRNPMGLAGALKKIGGYSTHAVLETTHAQEASHLFFANGLRQSFLGLFATHPPLEERIRMLDPSFDGDFGAVGAGVEAAAAGQARARPVSAMAAGFAGGSRIAVDPSLFVASVGTSSPEHLEYAAAAVSQIPDSLSDAVHDPYGARAVVYSLLFNKEEAVRKNQLDSLFRNADSGVYTETQRLFPRVEQLTGGLRLPLVDMAIPTLKELSPDQYARFRENVEHLVAADKQIDLFEYTLQRMITRHLDPSFGEERRAVTQYYDMKPLAGNCVQLLSCLAYWGADEAAEAAGSFDAGFRKLGLRGAEAAILPAESCGLDMLSSALNPLGAASPAIKKRVLDACVSCVGADGYVTLEESELLRAVADSLDCPVPPFLPTGPRQ